MGVEVDRERERVARRARSSRSRVRAVRHRGVPLLVGMAGRKRDSESIFSGRHWARESLEKSSSDGDEMEGFR